MTNPLRHTPRAVRRRAFTLLELMLVLAVLVVVTALTIPALSGPLDNHRLRRAGDQVRAAWAKARAEAMRTGRTHVFRFAPGTGNFTVEPWYSGDDYLESDELTTLTGAENFNTASLAGETSSKPETLPENVRFVGSETTLDLRAQLLAAADPEQASVDQLTPPIFFYANGSTSTARILLVNLQERYVTLTLRGLTGVAQVSGVQSKAEVTP